MNRHFTWIILAVGLTVPASAQQLIVRTSIPELEAAARRDSNDAQAQYALALGYWSKERYDDAERSLRLAVQIEPGFAAGYLALGTLPFARYPKLRKQLAKGKPPPELRDTLRESERFVRRAFLIDPLVDLQILGVVEPPEPMNVRVLGGRIIVFSNPFDAFRMGHYRDAFLYFSLLYYRHAGVGATDDTIPRDSLPSGLLWYHGVSAAHLAFYTAAIADFTVLANRQAERERDSLHAIPLGQNDFRYVLGLMEERAGRPADAVRHFREAIVNDVGLYMAHIDMAKTYESYQMHDSAAAESRRAVLANPDDPSMLLEHGILLTAGGQFAESVDTLQVAMAADPRDSRIPYYLGLAQQKWGHLVDARNSLERFLSLAPSRYAREIADAQQRLSSLS